jgi:hypothetical protein
MKDSPYFILIFNNRCAHCCLHLWGSRVEFSTNLPFGHQVFSQRGRRGENRYDTIQIFEDTHGICRKFYNGCIVGFGTVGFLPV